MNKTSKIILFILIVLLLLLSFIFLFRIFSSRQLDDVSPQIQCDKDLLEKADVLFVIPKFNNISIAENKTWCNYILSLNKTLAMHGVYHAYNEFYTDRNQAYVDEGREEFYKCFGFYPKEFKTPQLAITNNNKKLIQSQMKFDGYLNQFFHKAYHCSDTGRLSNKIIDVI